MSYHELTEKIHSKIWPKTWNEKDMFENVIREWLEKKAREIHGCILGDSDYRNFTIKEILGLSKDRDHIVNSNEMVHNHEKD